MYNIGVLEHLDPSRVTEKSFAQLRRRLAQAQRELKFHCEECGAPRTAICPDPGVLMRYALLCASAKGRPACQKPAQPIPERDPFSYVPGSLVLAPLHFEDNEMEKWPAIVEDHPYGDGPYRISPPAYYVTFIFSDLGKEPFEFTGGYISVKKLSPFVGIPPPKSCTENYMRALAKAKAAYEQPLATRLELLSFVAHVWRLRNGQLVPMTLPQKRKKSFDEGEEEPEPSGAGPTGAEFSGVGSSGAGFSGAGSSGAGFSGAGSPKPGFSGWSD